VRHLSINGVDAEALKDTATQNRIAELSRTLTRLPFGADPSENVK
jgi:hypothetical protein